MIKITSRQARKKRKEKKRKEKQRSVIMNKYRVRKTSKDICSPGSSRSLHCFIFGVVVSFSLSLLLLYYYLVTYLFVMTWNALLLHRCVVFVFLFVRLILIFYLLANRISDAYAYMNANRDETATLASSVHKRKC